MSGGAVVASGRAQRCADAEKRRVVHGELRRAVQAAIELVMHWAYGLQTGWRRSRALEARAGFPVQQHVRRNYRDHI